MEDFFVTAKRLSLPRNADMIIGEDHLFVGCDSVVSLSLAYSMEMAVVIYKLHQVRCTIIVR